MNKYGENVRLASNRYKVSRAVNIALERLSDEDIQKFVDVINTGHYKVVVKVKMKEVN